MVYGKGMIATIFESYRNKEDYIIFASGVSDSTNTDNKVFDREMILIIETIKSNKDKIFVYFSTCSIYDPFIRHSPYVQHKIKMENLIMKHSSSFIIFRLTNPIGNTSNTHTVFNYFISHITQKKEFTVWKNASRNIIDIDEVYILCNEILEQKLFINTIINIASPVNYPVPFIVESIENYFNQKASYTLVNKAGVPVIDTTAIDPILTKYNITFDEHYLDKLLKKYFPK